MSRQPPLPPGLPPKPPMDSYRPSSNSNSNRDRQPMYHFNGDNQRPSYEQRFRSPPRYNDYAHENDRHRENSYRARDGGYAPGTGPHYGDARSRRDDDYGRGSSYRPSRHEDDSYRSNDGGYGQSNGPYNPRIRPAGEVYGSHESAFTFRAEAPASIDFRSAGTLPPRQHNQQGSYNHQGNNGGNRQQSGQYGGQRGGHSYRGRGAPRLASDRAFLKGNRFPTPERMSGMEEDNGTGAKYIPVEDISDSDEAEMDMSEDAEAQDGQPKKKQARTETRPVDADSAPKWSNPDPYTVLPPTDDPHRKKKDVVKLIRKARIEAVSGTSAKTSGEAADFISFDLGEESDDTKDEAMQSKSEGVGVVGAPTGPRNLRDTLPKSLVDHGGSYSAVTYPAKTSGIVDLTSSPSPSSENRNGATSKATVTRPTNTVSLNAADTTFGQSRKRTIRDEIKHTPTLRDALSRGPRVQAAPIGKLKKGKPRRVDGSIVLAWQRVPGITPTPWVASSHSDTATVALWLHKEVMDFYHFVKPKHFEEFIRAKLVEDLQMRVRNSVFNADIQTFGSFPAGLYLPTADMDVVCVSDQYMRGGPKLIGQSNSSIRKFGTFLEREGLPAPNSLEVVLGAKVPLVKYIDKITGLKVDISFENNTGIIANKTFQDWKTDYPAMPILVTVIKHLLAMRGLNEPANGGIGGFSVTCLVVSLLQMTPQIQSGTMLPEHHLGEILMEFLDLYGNQFNVDTTGISLNPAAYISKSDIPLTVYKPMTEKFCIIDPNRSDNDIAGGSSNTPVIRRCFSDAYNTLQLRLGSLQYASDRRNQSLLGPLLGGNYESFRLQREHLYHLHEKLFGPTAE